MERFDVAAVDGVGAAFDGPALVVQFEERVEAGDELRRIGDALELEAGALLEPTQAALPLRAGAVGKLGEVALEVVGERDVRTLVTELDVGARRGQNALERGQ